MSGQYVKYHLIKEGNVTFDDVTYSTYDDAVNILERDYALRVFPDDGEYNPQEISKNLNNIVEVILEKANPFDMTEEELCEYSMKFTLREDIKGFGEFEISKYRPSRGLSIKFPVILKQECGTLNTFLTFIAERFLEFKTVYDFAVKEWII